MWALAVCALAVAPAHAAGPGDPSEAIAQAQAAIRAEILKNANVSKTVKEGVEAYRQQQALQNRAAELRETLRQPQTLCQTIQTQDALGAGTRDARAKVVVGQRKALQTLRGNPGAVVTLEAAHKASNTHFCTPEERAVGVCDGPSQDPRYTNLAGADQNAMFLFQSRSGNDTYAGRRDGPQTEAVDAYIRRVVVGTPPEMLRASGSGTYARTPQARAYVELQRRYEAFLSMATYSLNQTKEAHNPSK